MVQYKMLDIGCPTGNLIVYTLMLGGSGWHYSEKLSLFFGGNDLGHFGCDFTVLKSTSNIPKLSCSLSYTPSLQILSTDQRV